jgi:hypothetical protein
MEKEKVNREKFERALDSLSKVLPSGWEEIKRSGNLESGNLEKETNLLIDFKFAIIRKDKDGAKDALEKFRNEINEESVPLYQALKKDLENTEIIKNFDELFDSNEFNLLKEKIKKEYEDYKAEKEKKKRSFNERMEGNEENKVNKEEEQKKESILKEIQQKLRELHFPWP